MLLIVANSTPVVVACKTMETCWHSALAATKGKNAGANRNKASSGQSSREVCMFVQLNQPQSNQKPKQINPFAPPVARCKPPSATSRHLAWLVQALLPWHFRLVCLFSHFASPTRPLTLTHWGANILRNLHTYPLAYVLILLPCCVCVFLQFFSAYWFFNTHEWATSNIVGFYCNFCAGLLL